MHVEQLYEAMLDASGQYVQKVSTPDSFVILSTIQLIDQINVFRVVIELLLKHRRFVLNLFVKNNPSFHEQAMVL